MGFHGGGGRHPPIPSASMTTLAFDDIRCDRPSPCSQLRVCISLYVDAALQISLLDDLCNGGRSM